MSHTRQMPWSEEMQHHLGLENYVCAAVLLELAPRDVLSVSDKTMQGINTEREQVVDILCQRTQHAFPGDLIEEYAGSLHEQARNAVQWVVATRSTLIDLRKENARLRGQQVAHMQIEEQKRSDYERGAILGPFAKDIAIFFNNIGYIRKDIGITQKDSLTRRLTPQHRMCMLKIRTALRNLSITHQLYDKEVAALDKQININLGRLNEPRIAQSHNIPYVATLEGIIQLEVMRHFCEAVYGLDQELSKLFAESQDRLCTMLQRAMLLISESGKVAMSTPGTRVQTPLFDNYFPSDYIWWPHTL